MSVKDSVQIIENKIYKGEAFEVKLFGIKYSNLFVRDMLWRVALI